MKELLQRIYELILEPVIEVLRKLWEMPAEDFLASLWAVIDPLLQLFGIMIIAMIMVLSAFIIIVMIQGISRAIIQAIAVHRERNNRS